jgi:hypothetical protein
MCGRAWLWVGVDSLGVGSIAVLIDVPMNSCLTCPVSGLYALFPINFIVDHK